MRRVVFVLAASLLVVPMVGAEVIYSPGPGSGPPGGTLGGYTMTPFPPDSSPLFTPVTSIPTPIGGELTFTPTFDHRVVGSGWATWSHGYAGDVYYSLGATSSTHSLPPGTSAFYFYIEPNPFSLETFTVTDSSGVSSGPFTAHGSAGATYAGFYGTGDTTLGSITITASTDYAIGEFAIAGGGGGVDCPMAATGLDFADPDAGLDSFIEVFETVPDAVGVGPIGSTMGLVKDVAVDPTTGRVYTIDPVRGADGQQVYEVDPATGAGRALPSPTLTVAPDLVWGLAFDDRGTLFGGGLGIFTIDKDSGVATRIADLATVPALIWGMANSATGTGFTSTGILLVPEMVVPFVAEHAADGSFVSGTVSLLLDLSGASRLLFDIGLSDNGLLYGSTVPRSGSGGTATVPSPNQPQDADAALAAARAQSWKSLRTEAAKQVDDVRRRLAGHAGPSVHSDVVLVFSTPPYAFFTNGAPLDALLMGLGGTMDCTGPPPRSGDIDGDGDLDLDDYAVIAGCVTGPVCAPDPCEPPAYEDPPCGSADFDGDGDIDLVDLAAFFADFTGPI